MQTSDNLVLGIEGGGTKTEWLLARVEKGERMGVLERGALGPGNLRLLSDSELEAIFASLPREAGCVGAYLAGCATEQDRLRLRGLLARHWPGSRIACGSDRDSGFAAAFRDLDGIAVIAGTGSAVTGRREGQMEKAGGWGQLLGDLGSGYHLAMQGLRLALSSYDLEQQVTPLAQALLDRLGLGRLDQLAAWVMEANKMSVAKLAPVVFDAAKAGDPEMTAVIQAGAKALVEYTGAVARRLGMGEPEVQLMGGLFVHHPEYYDLFRDYLSDLLPGGQVQICTRSGAIGAVWLAARQGAPPGSACGGEPAHRSYSTYRSYETARAEPPTSRSPTELANARWANFDQLPVQSMVDLFVSEENEIAKALESNRANLCQAIQIASARLKSGGRLIYVGAGTSGRLGILDASEIPPTFGADPELVQAIIAGGEQAVFNAVEGAEDDREMALRMLDQRQVCDRDAVCGIAASGRTPFVLAALEKARELGAATVLVTCNPAREKNTRFDAEIDLPTGPEIIAGSTRLKAGTATKVTLNILSTCCMALLGKVRGNLMIDVRASNEKLRERAVRMVCQLRGCQPQEARKLLEKQGWNVRNCVS
jgi:N-acetylmuramic acid 6-phosphate etherase